MKIIMHKGHTIIINQKKRYITVEVTGPKYRASYKSNLTVTDALDYIANVELFKINQAIEKGE